MVIGAPADDVFSTHAPRELPNRRHNLRSSDHAITGGQRQLVM
jgi:hypothetical protein